MLTAVGPLMLLPDDELVDVIELIPVLITSVHIAEQRLKLGTARNTHVETLGSDESIGLKQVEVVPAGQSSSSTHG